MSRYNRLALPVAALLLLVLVGSVLAQPGSPGPAHQGAPEADDPPTAEDVAHARDRLAATELQVDEAVFTDLAQRYGVGGAVRLVAWSHATGESIERLADMRDGTDGEPMGWGAMARELGVHPGIGAIMGNGGGRGPDGAPGLSGDRPGRGHAGDEDADAP